MRHNSTHSSPHLLSVVLCANTTTPSLHAHLPPCLPHPRSLYTTLPVLLPSHITPLVSCVRPTHFTTSTPPHTPLPLGNQQVRHIAPHSAKHKTKHAMCCLSLPIKHPHKPPIDPCLFIVLVAKLHSIPTCSCCAIVSPICLHFSSLEASFKQ